MPFFSNSLTKDASVKRAGGLVKCWLGSSFSNLSTSPTFTAGNNTSSSDLFAPRTLVKPSKTRVRPLAFNSTFAASTVKVEDKYSAGVIWQATN